MENYELICQIGKGNFGSISKIIRKSDKKVLVWKELDYGHMSEKEKQQIVSEVNILRELKHPNIVRYYDRIIDKKNSKIYIIMEFCEGGDLGQLIKRCKKTKDYIINRAKHFSDNVKVTDMRAGRVIQRHDRMDILNKKFNQKSYILK